MGDSVFPWKPRLLVDATVAFITFHLGKTRRHMSALPGPATESSSVRFRFVTRRASPISISRFAHHVDAFLKVYEARPWVYRRQARAMGDRAMCIRGNEIMVIGTIHVSAGSWMPILQLSRYIL